jgi:type IV pilus assembly protein PilX
MELVMRARQRGLSLLFALLALAAMSLAAVALVQVVGAGSTVIGNISFKQDATAAADRATRVAITALYAKVSAATTGLDADISSIGYYASTNELIDVTGRQLTSSTRQLVNWQNSCDGASGLCTYTPYTVTDTVNSNTVQYVAFRLCSAAGDPTSDTTIQCAEPLAVSTVSGMYRGAIGVGGGSTIRTSDSITTPYYRIVVRVSGARNTVSYTETIVHF